jgi:hypothetical protein
MGMHSTTVVSRRRSRIGRCPMTEAPTVQSPFISPWVEAGVRKVLLPARRTGTLALSQDGRLAVAVSNVTSLLLLRSIEPNVAAYNGEKKPEGVILRDRGLAHIHALYPAVVDHELVSQFVGRPNARLFTSSTTADYVPSSEDVQAVVWAPRSRGPALLVADGSGELHIMDQPANYLSGVGVNVAGLFTPSHWNDITPSGSGSLESLPKRVTCAGFTSLQLHNNSLTTECDIVLLAIGSKTNLTLWHWPRGVTAPKLAMDVREGPISCLAWQETQLKTSERGETDSVAVVYLACGMSSIVYLYKVQCRLPSCSGEAPNLIADLVWSSDRLPGTCVSCMSWWREDASNISELRLACGVGNRVCMMRWLLNDAVIASRPELYTSSGGHKRIVSSTGFLLSGELVSSSLDGSVIIWQSPTSFPVDEPCLQADIELIGPSEMRFLAMTGQKAPKLQGEAPGTTSSCPTPRLWRPMAPYREIRASLFDQPVSAVAITGLKLTLVLLYTVPATGDDHEDDIMDDAAMRHKFRSSARLSRVALYVPEMQGTSPGRGEEALREFTVCILRQLLRNGDAGHAFTASDLERWVGRMDASPKIVVLGELMLLAQQLEGQSFGHHSNLSRMRAARCLSYVIQRAVDPSSQGDLSVEAERLHSRMTQSILVEYCAASLDCALARWRSSSAQSGYENPNDTDGSGVRSSMKEQFSDDETQCLQAMCAFVFGFTEESPLCDSGNAVRTAHDMLRLLAMLASSDGTFMCPVCVASDEPTVLTCTGDDSRMTFSCGEGDSYPRCVLTMGPCLSCVPLCCRGCGARASPGLSNGLDASSPARYQEFRKPQFAWLAEPEHCTLCLCRLEASAVDPPRFGL